VRKLKYTVTVLLFFLLVNNIYGDQVTWPYRRNASVTRGTALHRDDVILALHDGASLGLKYIEVDCVRKDLEKYLNPWWPYPELKVIIRSDWSVLSVQDRWKKPPARTEKGKASDPITIDVFPSALTDFKNCLHGVILHELIHAACFINEIDDLGEKLAYGCSHMAVPCAPSKDLRGNDYKDECTEENCKREKRKRKRRDPHPGRDRPDDNESVASPIYSDTPATFPVLSNALVLFNGFYAECEKLLESYSILTNLFELPESPEELRDVSDMIMIPTGGLYGMQNSEIFKAVLEEYVRNGGTLIVFTQQHGYEFSVLPTPDGEPIEAYGWREDQSWSSNSMYVDAWHPALSSTTRKLIGNPVDGYFSGYPSDSTVLLRRRINGMPALLSYPYEEGRVVVTSLFTDWVAFFQDKKIIRNLITWAKNPDLEIPEYNLRDNPDPEVNLNLELKNISDELASKAKILWLDPDRNLYFEEEKLVSIPDAGNTYSCELYI